jgi:hypothetical protein
MSTSAEDAIGFTGPNEGQAPSSGRSRHRVDGADRLFACGFVSTGRDRIFRASASTRSRDSPLMVEMVETANILHNAADRSR